MNQISYHHFSMFKELSFLVLLSMASFTFATNMQSNEGAQTCILIRNGGASCDGVSSFPAVSSEALETVYYTMVEHYYIFDVNITTDVSIYDSYPTDKKASVVVGGTGAKGVAWYKFGDNVPVHADADVTPKTAVHEMGHVLGIDHDGVNPTNTSGYLLGEWPVAPIMGQTYLEPEGGGAWVAAPIYHWYNGADGNAQDDIALIGAQLGFATDDYPLSTPLIVDTNGTILAVDNFGGIQSQTDVDVWDFTLDNSAEVSFLIKPSQHTSPALFAGAWIENIQGDTVAVGSSYGTYLNEAKIATTTLIPGSYALHVDGVAPSQAPMFSDYSSFGPYTIEGAIADGVVTLTTSTKTVAPIRTLHLFGNELKLTKMMSGNIVIRLYNTRGQQVFHSRSFLSEETLGLSIKEPTLSTGVYLLQLLDNSSVQNFMIQIRE